MWKPPPFTAGGPGGSVALDLIGATPSLAYSLRKLRSAYAGAAYAGNNGSTTIDIGFSGNAPDTAAALAHAAAGDTNCHVLTVYDQSGNAHNCTKAVNGCFSVLGNTLQTLGSKATLTAGSGLNRYYTTSRTTAQVFGTGNWSWIGIARAAAWSSAGAVYQQAGLFGDDGNGALGMSVGSSGEAAFKALQYDGAFKTASVAASLDTDYVVLVRYDGTNLKIYVNGGTGGSVAVGACGDTSATQFVGREGGDSWTGKWSEAISFASLLSVSDSNILGADMAAHIGATWTNIS